MKFKSWSRLSHCGETCHTLLLAVFGVTFVVIDSDVKLINVKLMCANVSLQQHFTSLSITTFVVIDSDVKLINVKLICANVSLQHCNQKAHLMRNHVCPLYVPICICTGAALLYTKN